MSFLMVARLVSVLCTGLVAGILLGDRMGASLARPKLEPSSFVQFQQIQHVRFARMMPPLIVSAILSGSIWLFLTRSGAPRSEFWLVAAATAGVLLVLGLTLTVNVPINNQLMTWSVDSPPTNVRQLWAPWEQVHTIRTILAVCAFAFEVLGLNLSSLHA